MSEVAKKYAQKSINKFIGYYADYCGKSIEEAKAEMDQFGALDYALKWYPLLGHGKPEQIARRLNSIVEENKQRRIAYGM
jgi:protein-disulfide isomerase